jgi:hypothetical protein
MILARARRQASRAVRVTGLLSNAGSKQLVKLTSGGHAIVAIAKHKFFVVNEATGSRRGS